MNEETKKSLMKLGVLGLPDMTFEEWQRLKKEIAQEIEAEFRKTDPKFVKRYEASDSMQESETGEMVRYEDFIRIVTDLENKLERAKNIAQNNSCGGCGDTYSWRL